MAKNLGNVFINAEEGLVDATGNHTVVLNNGVSTSSTIKKYGNKSLEFSGSNYCNLQITELHKLYGLPFTIDFWLKWPPGGGTDADSNKVVTKSRTIPGGWGIVGSNGSRLRFQTNNTTILTTATAINDNVWHHVAFVREDTGTGGFKVYVDGKLDGTADLAANLNREEVLQLCSKFPSTTYMDNFRLVKNAALWTDEFNLTEYELCYTDELPANSYVRPDNISGLYSIVSSNKGNLRGKAAEGYIRPTLKQFFTSTDFEEVESAITITSDDFSNLDYWKLATTNGHTKLDNDEVALRVNTGYTSHMLHHDGVLEGDFDFTIDYNSGSVTTNEGALSIQIGKTYRRGSLVENLDSDGYLQGSILRSVFGTGTIWTIDSPPGQGAIYTGAPVSGKLRGKRSGSTLQIQIYKNSSWTTIKSTDHLGTVDLYLSLGVSCWNSANTSTAKFDNLSFSEGSLKVYNALENTATITSDTFENLDDWKFAATDGSADIVSNKLEVEIHKQNTGCWVHHTGKIEGDFNFTIDYDSSSLINGSSQSLFLTDEFRWLSSTETASTNVGNQITLGIAKLTNGQLTVWGNGSQTATGMPTTGQLRCTRTGNSLQFRYWKNSQWNSAGVYTTLGEQDIYLSLKQHNWHSNNSATGKWDNLNFTSGNIKIYS